jgi:nucleoside-diphosphate-sugar epimerase
MSKIVVTGSHGTIGSVVYEGLRAQEQHDVVGLDLPEHDVRDYENFLENIHEADVIVHAAHNIGETATSDSFDHDNILMNMNVFRAAVREHVGRVIMMSSVHAATYRPRGEELWTPENSRDPSTPYGVHKRLMERDGEFFAKNYGLGVVAFRPGGVTRSGLVRSKETWLSHPDLQNAISACVNAESVPGGFAVFYAVSNNDDRMHSFDNPFGWEPRDNSRDVPLEKS